MIRILLADRDDATNGPLETDLPNKPTQENAGVEQTRPTPDEVEIIDEEGLPKEDNEVPEFKNKEPNIFDEPEGDEESVEPVGELPDREVIPEYEPVEIAPQELDVLNDTLSKNDKIRKHVEDGYPLRMGYKTRIQKNGFGGLVTERTVSASPQTGEQPYLYQAKTTGNLILVTWDHLRGDWRGFIVSNIFSSGGVPEKMLMLLPKEGANG